MSLGNRSRKKKSNASTRIIPVVIAVVFVVVLVGVFVTFFEWNKPTLQITTDMTRTGSHKEIAITISDLKSGIRSLEIYFEQDGKKYKFLNNVFLREDHFPYSGPKNLEEIHTVNVKSLGVDEGEATLVVHVRDFSLWGWFDGNSAMERISTIVDTLPPAVAVTGRPRYIKPGSAGIVVYTINEPLLKYGVRIDGYSHPGYPLPSKGKDVYGATIAMPVASDAIKSSYVFAEDLAGNETHVPFGMILRNDSGKSDIIDISDNFLNRKIPEFEKEYPDIPGTRLEKYIYINNKIRSENSKMIQEACSNSVPEKLWDGPFLRLAGSARKAGFADRRTYKYHGREIDRQTHLGVDLASTRFAEVRAANRGKVVFADYLGIYGNAVILDHGLGIFSLYSHLSQISVKKDDPIDKDTLLGLTGTTGMAGGDHLHFSMLVNGVFVNPVEWWDASWVRYNISNVL
jgi:murein DD-endopeptidase MepM/ murein hydrolase activator NlpD